LVRRLRRGSGGTPPTPIFPEKMLAPSSRKHLALRQGRWIDIENRGGGGFGGNKPGEHSLGGPAALQFTGETNSDIEDGRFKPNAPLESRRVHFPELAQYFSAMPRAGGG
jgi:hypothetical protein